MTEDLKELLGRKMVAESIIKELETVSDSDSRKQEAIDHYKKQLSNIESRIDKSKPKDVVIGLKSANLTAKRG